MTFVNYSLYFYGNIYLILSPIRQQHLHQWQSTYLPKVDGFCVPTLDGSCDVFIFCKIVTEVLLTIT